LNLAGQTRDRVRELKRERVTVQEAARRLDITESAVRKRVQRGLLEHDKESDGRLYVYLDTRDMSRDEVRDSSYDMLVRRLENENEFLRRELERKDTILLNMTEAMKALNPPAQEAPSEARESPQTVEEESDRAEPRPATGGTQEGTQRSTGRSLWRRIFGG
jgi:predicted ArsR family transcriptional regulator